MTHDNAPGARSHVPEWEWCGYAHHFIGADECRFHLATFVGGGTYLVSTVGDYRPQGERRTLGMGASSFFETYVFTTDPDDRDDDGHPTVTHWSEVDGERWATEQEATAGHLAACWRWENQK